MTSSYWKVAVDQYGQELKRIAEHVAQVKYMRPHTDHKNAKEDQVVSAYTNPLSVPPGPPSAYNIHMCSSEWHFARLHTANPSYGMRDLDIHSVRSF
jgi:hypothetical protein